MPACRFAYARLSRLVVRGLVGLSLGAGLSLGFGLMLPGAASATAADQATDPAIRFSLPNIPYTAERRVADGRNWQAMRVYYRPGMERMELEGEAAGGNVIIVRFDRDLTWVLMPRLHIYLELPGEVDQRFRSLMSSLVLTPEGSARVNGERAEKYRVSGRLTGTMWLDRHGIPLRIVGETVIGGKSAHADVEQTDIRTGQVAPGLFDLPAGYSRVALTDPSWIKLLQRFLPPS